MKKIITFILTFIFIINHYAQSTGDVAVIGCNFDEPDDILFVTFIDIPANTDIYITDYSWDGSAWTGGGAAGWLKYTTPSTGLSAGEVVQIRLGSPYTATTGTITSDGGLFNLINVGGSGDKFYAYLGTDKDNPTTFLFAISTGGSWGVNELTNTGLTTGVNALVFSDGMDNLIYNGTRTGTTTELKSLIADVATNWSTKSSKYYFSTTSFNILDEIHRPTDLSIEEITSSRIRITWTKPSGEYGTDWNGVVVFVCQGTQNDGDPDLTDGSSYIGNYIFGSGTSFGSGYAVINKTTDEDGDVRVDGLTNGEEYYIIAYTYKTEIGENNDSWSIASAEINDQAEVQGVTDLSAIPSTELVDISWRNYFGTIEKYWDEVMIVAKAGNAVDGIPSGDGTSYTANATWGNGTQIGNGNFVVYKGTGVSETIVGLTNDTEYFFRAFVRFGSDWTDADQYQDISSTPVLTIEEPSVSELIISEVNDVLWSHAAYFELYNNTNSAIKLKDVFIEYYINGSSYPSEIYLFSSSKIIPAGGYYTISQGSGFYDKYGKYSDGAFSYGALFPVANKDGLLIKTINNGIIDQFNNAPGATVSRLENNLYERKNYPNDGSDLSLHWQNVGYDQYGTPGETNNTPLPVELTTFNATKTNNGVELIWETATEINNYGFEIQRFVETDNFSDESWLKIGFIEGSGNSNSPKKYSFLDPKLVGGSKLVYRLKQIDIDGSFEYSDKIEVEIIPSEYELFQNYPNPFNPTTTIKYSIPNIVKSDHSYNTMTIKVYDVLGAEVTTLVNKEQKPGIYQIKFDAADLPSGTYFYRLTTENFTKVNKMLLIK